MQLLKLLCYPDVSLRAKCEPVDIDKLKEMASFIAELTRALYAYDGLAIAAPQVGASTRIIVVDLRIGGTQSASPPLPLVMVNPEILSNSEEQLIEQEGCLSFPGVFVPIARHKSVTVSFVGQDGKPVGSMTFNGMQARAIQHELEHLDGRTLEDHIDEIPSRLRRGMLWRKLLKVARRKKSAVPVVRRGL